MVRIPYIKIPSVRVGIINPTPNIGTGGATLVPPTPITYRTQWKIVGNSEVHGNEIWSCGEYNSTDGKWHILVQPQGGSIADIALTEPLRKVNDVADTIEFPSGTLGKAVLTRRVDTKKDISSTCLVLDNRHVFSNGSIRNSTKDRIFITDVNEDDVLKLENLSSYGVNDDALWAFYSVTSEDLYTKVKGNNDLEDYVVAVGVHSPQTYTGYSVDNLVVPAGAKSIVMLNIKTEPSPTIIKYNELSPLATPTTELVDAPQIAEADSYSMVISQGGKAVSWSSFETDSE